MAEREPGQLAFETYRAHYTIPVWKWEWAQPEDRQVWAAVEAAIRADERERCAKVAEASAITTDTTEQVRLGDVDYIASAIRQEPEHG